MPAPVTGGSLGVLTFNVSHSTAVMGLESFDTCDLFNSVASPVTGDYSAHVIYSLGNMAAGASKTVKFIYKRH